MSSEIYLMGNLVSTIKWKKSLVLTCSLWSNVHKKSYLFCSFLLKFLSSFELLWHCELAFLVVSKKGYLIFYKFFCHKVLLAWDLIDLSSNVSNMRCLSKRTKWSHFLSTWLVLFHYWLCSPVEIGWNFD